MFYLQDWLCRCDDDGCSYPGRYLRKGLLYLPFVQVHVGNLSWNAVSGEELLQGSGWLCVWRHLLVSWLLICKLGRFDTMSGNIQ